MTPSVARRELHLLLLSLLALLLDLILLLERRFDLTRCFDSGGQKDAMHQTVIANKVAIHMIKLATARLYLSLTEPETQIISICTTLN